MRFMIVLLLATLLLLPFADTTFAQMEEEEEEQWVRIPYHVTISVDAGIGMPFNPAEFGDLWNSSLPVTFAVGYVVIPYIEVRGWITYASWGISGIPAQEAIGTPGVHDVQGGTITTLLYGASAKINPLPNSRIQPSFEIGGGAFKASGDDLEVGTHHTNTMEDASGPVFQFALKMEYGVNETWQVYTGFNYYLGFSDTFAPGNLLLSGPNDTPAEGDNLQFGALVLGITLKL
jgi:hypothetical protein